MTLPFRHMSEPYSDGFLLMSSIYPVLCTVAVYLFFSLQAGPHLMKNRKPYELKKVILCYNSMQIILNLYFLKRMTFEILPAYNFKCSSIPDASTHFGRAIISLTNFSFLIRLLELPETVMFILRKKFSQVTTLHVYHHTMMVLVCWSVSRYLPGGNAMVAAYLNSFVHVVMYSYYLSSALNDNKQKNIWWKKYITILQLVQFVIVGIHSFQSLFRSCNYPKFIMVFFVLQSAMFFKMFGEFYVKSYLKPKKSISELKKS